MPGSSNEPGCGASSREPHGSLAGRRAEVKKRFCCVTTRGLNLGALNTLRRSLYLLTAIFLGLGMTGSNLGIAATFDLPTNRLPPPYQPPAFTILAITLVPTPRLVLAPASFAQTRSRTESAYSG
jgi:hypothetical protein